MPSPLAPLPKGEAEVLLEPLSHFMRQMCWDLKHAGYFHSNWQKSLRGARTHCRGRDARAGVAAEEIKLVAVTKYVGKAEIEALVAAGCTDLGESRPQQLWQRAEELADLPIRWHLIGHLQRNKVRRTLPLASMIHSADSLRIIKAIDETAAELGRRVAILLEVNTSGEPAKGGFQAHDVEALLPELAEFRARGNTRTDVHGKPRRRTGGRPAGFRRLAKTPRPDACALSAGNCFARTIDGHERRL